MRKRKMITTSVTERNQVHGTILRHLNMPSSLAMAARAETTAHNGPTGHSAPEPSADGAYPGVVLYYLLVKYVKLLEDDQHGGWTQEEDDVVLTVISALLSLGWDIRQPAR
jgi:hypothetical protein